MRSDVKLGLAIGGVLMAVVIVYAISTRPHNKTGAQLASGSPEQQPAADPIPDSPRPESAATGTPLTTDVTGAPSSSTEPTAITSETAPAPVAQPDPKKDLIWANLLTNGQRPAASDALTRKAIAPTEKLDNKTGPSDIAPETTVTSTPTAPAGTASADAGTTIIHADYTTTPSTHPGNGTTHTVQQGETFSSISAVAYGSSKYFAAIIKANPNVDPKHLKPHTVIVLPDASEVVVAPRDTATHAATPTTHPAIAHDVVTVVMDPKTEYAVAAGDSLYRISVKLYGNPTHESEIYEANKGVIGSDPAKLKLGTLLHLVTAPTK